MQSKYGPEQQLEGTFATKFNTLGQTVLKLNLRKMALSEGTY